MPHAPQSDPETLLVSCLCAQWCGTCETYRAVFLSLQSSFAQVRFEWIDIEDQAELVDPVEVDDFPCLLIVRHGVVQFFGSVTPHLETLRRLIQAQLAVTEATSSATHTTQSAQYLAAQGLARRMAARG